MASRRPSGGSGRLLLLGLGSISVSLFVFATSRSVIVSMLALAILGASQVAYYSTTNTLIQLRVPARLRGRVHSLYVLTSIGLLPIGNLASGAIAERTGVPVVLAVGALVTLGATIIAAVARPSLRKVASGATAHSAVGPEVAAFSEREGMHRRRALSTDSTPAPETFSIEAASDNTNDRSPIESDPGAPTS